MQSLPPIDWALARSVAAPLGGELPTVSRAEVHALVASLRLAAQRAGDLVEDVSPLPGVPAQHVVVSDRATWAAGATRMVESVLEQLPLEAASGRNRRVRAAAHGILAGIGMGMVGRHLLGQFDPASSTLFLLAPNILHIQRARGFVMPDFQLWVSAHEQTHAFQFSAADWLQDYLMERFEIIAVDDVGTRDVIRGIAGGRGFSASMTSPAAQQAFTEITAAMTLLEGHADFVSDSLGNKHIPSVRALRRAFAREGTGSVLSRLAPVSDKNAQYREGLAFCRAVSRRAGKRALVRAYEAPEFLPTAEETADAELWLKRVHGAT